MDFIRAAIKTCFYDYPRALVSKMIREGQYDKYCSPIVDLAKWSEPAFTLTEQRLLNNIIREKWMKKSLAGLVEGSEMSRVFLMLNHFSNEVLDDAASPVVKFENLLRWHELSLYLGENLLTCAFLAEKDLLSGNKRKTFTWPDILPHNNDDLNKILDQGLSDVHAHLFATTDVFAENWVSLMNHVAFADKNGQLIDFDRAHQDKDEDFWDENDPLTLHQWGIVAAAIRSQLAGFLFLGKPFDAKCISGMVSNASICISKVGDILGDISDLSDYALRMSNNAVLDYAINKKDVGGLTKDDLVSPYMLHLGERRLLYCYFQRYYDKDCVAIDLAPFVYLYTLIKSKFRREFIQTNPLLGFENFKNYQDEKDLYAKPGKLSIAYRYAVQTAIGKEGKDNLEARVNSSSVNPLWHHNYKHTLFGDSDFFERDVTDNLRLVVHFLKTKEKEGDKSYRHFKLRRMLNRQMLDVIHNAQRNESVANNKAPILVGIDAAGAEANCRPEVFAPYFRWARMKGLTNMTFHAGEDFYDIIDGLRTIDETILFMEYQRGCRIGHGLALGTNPYHYYSNRHFRAIMPKQYMLDNCVWLLYKSRQYGIGLNGLTLQFLEEKIHSLLSEIGYGEGIDMYYYWQSILLRGDARNVGEISTFPTFRESAICMDEQCKQARQFTLAIDLHERYETDAKIREKGGEPDEFKYPRSICEDVYAIQEKMLTEIENKGICIECNPSSNLKIGVFERFEELPIVRFYNIKEPYRHRVNVSINTDDRGVFSTSIHNEYSLMAISLAKARDEKGNRKYSNEEIYGYLKQIIQNGHNQRFDKPEMKIF